MRRILIWIALICGVGGASAFAQTPDVTQANDEQQLKDEVKRLEQLTEELKARLAALEKAQTASAEKSQTAAPQVVNANLTKPTAAANTAPPAAGLNNSTNSAPLEEIAVVATPASKPAPQAERDEEKKEDKSLDLYGFAMLDMGYNFGQINPDWFDVVRPTQLPSSPNEFGKNGSLFTGVRQSRVGAKANLPTPLGTLKTIWEWELFGVGVDAGQTTFRLRHAWGEIGQFGAGQTWSPFMDPDVFPNSIEYWGPNGMAFYRNVQVRWMPLNKGNHQIYFALERPGASGDQGVLAGRIELASIQGRFPAPDLSARFRWGGERWHVQVAGIGRYIRWDDLATGTPFNFSDSTWGWGVNLSSNLPVAKKDILKLSVTYGDGIENYMNDAPVDIAPRAVPTNLIRPVTGIPLPIFGLVAFYDRFWSERWSSSLGYSMLRIDNSVLQLPSDFHKGQYALANLLFYPIKNVMVGGEFQWGQRENFTDGFIYNDYRVQFSARYNWDYKFGGSK